MSYTNSAMVVRTKRNTIEGCVAIVTHRYISQNPDAFKWGSMIVCEEFTFGQNGFGDIIIDAKDQTHDKKTPIQHKITINNVKSIEIHTHFVM